MEGLCSKCKFPWNREDHEKIFHWLIQCGTSLICAAQNGHEHCVNTLIQSGADVNYSNSDSGYCTALMFAARHGEEKCVDALIKAGADLNCTKRSGDTALSLAAKKGHESCLQLLIQAGADVNQVGKKDICHFGADVNHNKHTALMLAAHGGHVASVKMLLEAGADVNKVGYRPRGEHNCRALAHAVQDDHDKCLSGGDRFPDGVDADECVNLLLKAGAVVSNTDFLNAAKHCNYKCLDMFLNVGADVNVRCNKGFTILQVVMLHGSDKRKCQDIPKSDGTYMTINHNQLKCLDMLIKAGASVNASAHDGSTALTEAAAKSQVECANFLIQQGADVNQHDNNGATALMHADSVECVDLLIQAGADVNTRDNKGYTALFQKNLRYWRIGPAKRLLKEGAKINLTKNRVHRTRQTLKTDEQIILLLAAGEKRKRFRDKDIPEMLKFENERLQLKHMCREAIRKHLIDLDGHANLFGRIPQLGLPSILNEYLLYDESLVLYECDS